MQLKYNPKEILKEAKSRVAKNSKKKSFTKSIKRIFITILCTAIVAGISVLLSKAGVEIESEQKAVLIKYLIEIILGGGALGFLTLFGADVLKKRD